MPLQDDIHEWLVTLPAWQQELFLQAVGGDPLDPKTRASILDALLGDIDAEAAMREVSREALPADLTAGSTFELLSIEHIAGVNRLADGEALRFIPRGINVVYGFNGSGKSGWARIPKHAGRALHDEAVLGDVYSGSEQSPSPVASIRWQLAGVERQSSVSLDVPATGELAGMCVFDAQCGGRLLSDDHEIDYVPLAVEAVQRFYHAHAEISEELQSRLRDLQDPPLSLDAYAPTGRVYEALSQLGAETDLEALRELAEAADATHRDDLLQQVAEIDANRLESLARAAERDAARADALARDLGEAAGALGAQALLARRRDRDSVAAAQEAAARLSATRFRDEPIGGAGTDAWMVMWNAAKTFMRETHDHDWPAGATHCPTCMQELTPDARARVADFEEFVRSDAERQLAQARSTLAEHLAALPDVDALRVEHSAALTAIDESDWELATALSSWLDHAKETTTSIREGTDAEPVGPIPDVVAWGNGRRAAASAHRALQDPGTEAALRNELDDLRNRDVLLERWDGIQRRVERARQAARLGEAENALRTSAVSNRLRIFTASFVTSDLQKALEEQLLALNFDGLEVIKCRTSGRGGAPRVGLKIKTRSDVSLRSVLSDGEQRRLALAFFLAEVSVAYPGAPIVLDDPVCSIDHLGRRHIANTLARTARDRQVIVFTHELAFLHELQRAAKAQQLELHAQYVAKRNGRTGHVSEDLPWAGKTGKQRIGELKTQLQDIEAMNRRDPDSSEYEPAAYHFCGLLRQAFERILEDEVLGGVVTRSDGGVHPQQLKDVAWSDEICSLVDHGMADTSPWVHDRSRAANPAPPTPAELREGLEILEALRKAANDLRTSRRKMAAEVAQTPGEPTANDSNAEDSMSQLPGIAGAA